MMPCSSLLLLVGVTLLATHTVGESLDDADSFSSLSPTSSPFNFSELSAVPTIVPSLCSLPKDPGICLRRQPRYYFDTAVSACLLFYYKGCAGNANRFFTEAECQGTCLCSQPPATGSFRSDEGERCRSGFRFFYDPRKRRRKCRRFFYRGCNGNGNNFSSRDECKMVCLFPNRDIPNGPLTGTSRLNEEDMMANATMPVEDLDAISDEEANPDDASDSMED